MLAPVPSFTQNTAFVVPLYTINWYFLLLSYDQVPVQSESGNTPEEVSVQLLLTIPCSPEAFKRKYTPSVGAYGLDAGARKNPKSTIVLAVGCCVKPSSISPDSVQVPVAGKVARV